MLPQCYLCGAETPLYYFGTPVCLECVEEDEEQILKGAISSAIAPVTRGCRRRLASGHVASFLMSVSSHASLSRRDPPPNIGTGVKRNAENVANQALRGNLPDEARSTDRVGR
jgi:hypothetical protein